MAVLYDLREDSELDANGTYVTRCFSIMRFTWEAAESGNMGSSLSENDKLWKTRDLSRWRQEGRVTVAPWLAM